MCAANIKSYLCKKKPNKPKNMSNKLEFARVIKVTEDLIKYVGVVFHKDYWLGWKNMTSLFKKTLFSFDCLTFYFAGTKKVLSQRKETGDEGASQHAQRSFRYCYG